MGSLVGSGQREGVGRRTVRVAAHEADPAWFAVEADEDGEVARREYALVESVDRMERENIHDAADEGADASGKRLGRHGLKLVAAGGAGKVLERVEACEDCE